MLPQLRTLEAQVADTLTGKHETDLGVMLVYNNRDRQTTAGVHLPACRSPSCFIQGRLCVSAQNVTPEGDCMCPGAEWFGFQTGGCVMHVFVLDTHKKPLTPCHPAMARKLLKTHRAVVVRLYPFVIRLKDRTAEESVVKPVRVKVDHPPESLGCLRPCSMRNLTISSFMGLPLATA